jgi:hypothetical protein
MTGGPRRVHSSHSQERNMCDTKVAILVLDDLEV